MWRIQTLLGMFAPRRAGQDYLSAESAKAIIEAEIAKRNWTAYDARNYNLSRTEGRAIWRCRGFVGGQRGGVMVLEIDARSGALLRATAGGR